MSYDMNRLENTVLKFLQKRHVEGKKVLLGLSGGPDSLALFYVLLACKSKLNFTLSIAHVDHRWRPESQAEANQLAQLAEKLQLPFHLHVLNPQTIVGNLEEQCRNERLHFFKKLCSEHGYHAVLLGHHADDQAETVLKRILEGSSVFHISSLKEEKVIDDVNMWRPFLTVSKKDILDYLTQKNLHPFCDHTNHDPKFLRGRLRTKILPQLEQNFGKNVSRNLCELANELNDLQMCLSDIVSEYLAKTINGPMGSYLDLSNVPHSKTVLKQIITEFCLQVKFPLSREMKQTATELVITGKGDKKLVAKGRTLIIDRKHLFFPHPTMLSLNQCSDPLKIGNYSYGPWKVTVSSESSPLAVTGWQHAWLGQLQLSLPQGEFHLGPPKRQANIIGRNLTLDKLWTNEKVPAFLRSFVPVIWTNEGIYHEFLTTKNYPASIDSASISVNLSLIN